MITKIDFFARQNHFLDHMLPVWEALPDQVKGSFYIHEEVMSYAITNPLSGGFSYKVLYPEVAGSLRVNVPGENPLYVCSYGDFINAYRTNQKRIYMLAEHGVGISFGDNAGYAGGKGSRIYVDAFMSSSVEVAKKNTSVFNTPVYVIGVPKMDEYYWKRNRGRTLNFFDNWFDPIPENPTVCLSFHWNGSHIAPEAGNCFDVFGKDEVLQVLKKEFNLVAHCHPKARSTMIPVFERNGIPFIELEEVFDKADILINDASSIAYEFLLTGKRVVFMDSMKFRRGVDLGVRFWRHSKIAPHAKTLKELVAAVKSLSDSRVASKYEPYIKKAIVELYPYFGHASSKAAEAIISFTNSSYEDDCYILSSDKHDPIMSMISENSGNKKQFSLKEIQHFSYIGSRLPENSAVIDLSNTKGKVSMAINCHIKEGCELHWFTNNPIEAFNYSGIKSHWREPKQSFKSYKYYNEGENGKKKPPINYLVTKDIEEDGYWLSVMPVGSYISIFEYGDAYPENTAKIKKFMQDNHNSYSTVCLVGRIYTIRRTS